MEKDIPLTSSSHSHHEQHEGATPTGVLKHEHEVILRALGLLERFGRDLAAGKPVDREGLKWLIDFFRTFVDRCHHGKEEQHLFPAMERYGIPREGGPVGVMLYEHEEGRGFIRAMAEGDDLRTAEAIRSYASLLRPHIDKENGILYILADQVIPDEEQHALVRAFDELEEKVVGPGIHEMLLAKLAQLEGR
jgi:hemerythrin-like domain-containing protein